MKLNKTLALTALVAGSLFAGSTLQAQDSTNTPPNGPGMHGRPNVDQIAKELSLTDDQKAKVKAVLEDTQKQMRSLREDTSLSQDDKRTKGKEIREAMQAKMKEILTADQYAKWQQHMQHNRPSGGAGGDNAPKNN